MGRGPADGSTPPDRRALPQAGALAAEASMSERSYAFRFISGKYQGGEYPLTDSGELVIGRSSDLDLVLIEDMVSRKHAQLTLAAGRITIADLGSTNGTFVNGEKVRRAQLKEGDRILIGTSIVKLVARPAGDDQRDRRRDRAPDHGRHAAGPRACARRIACRYRRHRHCNAALAEAEGAFARRARSDAARAQLRRGPGRARPRLGQRSGSGAQDRRPDPAGIPPAVLSAHPVPERVTTGTVDNDATERVPTELEAGHPQAVRLQLLSHGSG